MVSFSSKKINLKINSKINSKKIKSKINFEFSFTDSYEDYCNQLVQGFKGNEDQKYDVLTNKNSIYIFYQFNGYLERLLQSIKPVRQSLTTDDDLALEVIQNENWQYFFKHFLQLVKPTMVV